MLVSLLVTDRRLLMINDYYSIPPSSSRPIARLTQVERVDDDDDDDDDFIPRIHDCILIVPLGQSVANFEYVFFVWMTHQLLKFIIDPNQIIRYLYYI